MIAKRFNSFHIQEYMFNAGQRLSFLYVFLTSIMLSSCSEKVSIDQEYFKREIEALQTTQQKQEYLEAIFKIDQDVRDDSTLILKYDKESPEYSKHYEKMRLVDEMNLQKIEAYLNQFGYPSRDAMSEIALFTPYVVIHHSSTTEDRRRNFPFLKEAYKDGNLSESSFSMYLARWYQMEFNERLDMRGSYKEKDKIRRMLDSLSLSM